MAALRQWRSEPLYQDFARLVAESTGSIIETQDALSHKNPANTRVCGHRMAVKSDKHSEDISRLLGVSVDG
jgi:hypothetical protein